jgi:hypothetical protein
MQVSAVTGRGFLHAALTPERLPSRLDHSAVTAAAAMSNIPVAFLVLGAFFTLYLVAALWRSRPK